MTANAYSPWAELAGLTDVSLEWRQLAGRLGQYVHRTRTITLDPRMPRRQQRSVLCHELRHATAGDVRTACDRVNLRQEQRADHDAARLLIHLDDLARALVLHEERLSAVAVELRVSDAILDIRLHRLHPSERHYLTRRLSDGLG